MFSFLRSELPPRTDTATQSVVAYDGGLAEVVYHGPGSDFFMTTRMPGASRVPGGASILTPPFHLHLYQDETFRVLGGKGNFYIGLDTQPAAVLEAAAPGAAADKNLQGPVPAGATAQTVTIKARRYHRFENASAAEDLVVAVLLTPERYESEARFFRNFFGYLEDCKRSATEPSVFQLMVFLEAADTPLGIPLPWEPLGVLVSRAVTAAMGFWGRWALGYQTSYPEYYEEGKTVVADRKRR